MVGDFLLQELNRKNNLRQTGPNSLYQQLIYDILKISNDSCI